MQTVTYELLEQRLGRSLDAYVSERRAAGVGWRKIATALADDTGRAVSYETLRAWFREDNAA